jgi:acyl-CoA thioester hydrolase
MNGLPGSGVVTGTTHFFPIRVYYEDTDAGGIVYHANYLRFAERARSECLRVLGWPFERLQAETGLACVVRRAQIEFRQAARLDDALIVATSIAAFSPASVDALQVIRRGTADLVELRLQLVLIKPNGQLSRIPPMLRDVFRPVFEAAPSAFAAPPGVAEPGGI